MFIRKTIEINNNDIQEILINLPIKPLTDEILSRNANLIVDHLNEEQQLHLLQTLLKDINSFSEIEEELKYQYHRRCVQTLATLSCEEIVEQLLKDYTLSRILQSITDQIRNNAL